MFYHLTNQEKTQTNGTVLLTINLIPKIINQLIQNIKLINLKNQKLLISELENYLRKRMRRIKKHDMNKEK